MMKERIQGILIGVAITIAFIGTLSFASQRAEYVERFYKDIKITLNGIIVEPKDVNGNDAEPFIIDGTTYLPVRAICNALGLKVNWNAETNTVELVDENPSVKNSSNNTSIKNDSTITDIRTQYGIENDNSTKTKNESKTTTSQTESSSSGAKLTGTPTEMQKKALEDAKEHITSSYNWVGTSEKGLKNYLSGKYVNSEVKYAMDNIDVDWNEQALKCANFLKSSYSTRSSLRMYLNAYGFTEENIEYAINHMGDFWKRSAVKYANMFDPDYEFMKLENGQLTKYKKTFEEHMKEYDFTDEEIEFAREELKYKQ